MFSRLFIAALCKMVQDCVFARSSKFQFGVRRKNGYNPGSAGSEFGERTGITLVRQVRSGVRTGPNPGSAGSEFGERPVPFSELRTLTGSEFGERTRCNPGTWPNPGSAGSEFGERSGPNLGSAGSEKGPGRTLVWQVWSSEKDRFLLRTLKKRIKMKKKCKK